MVHNVDHCKITWLHHLFPVALPWTATVCSKFISMNCISLGKQGKAEFYGVSKSFCVYSPQFLWKNIKKYSTDMLNLINFSSIRNREETFLVFLKQVLRNPVETLKLISFFLKKTRTSCLPFINFLKTFNSIWYFKRFSTSFVVKEMTFLKTMFRQ